MININGSRLNLKTYRKKLLMLFAKKIVNGLYWIEG